MPAIKNTTCSTAFTRHICNGRLMDKDEFVDIIVHRAGYEREVAERLWSETESAIANCTAEAAEENQNQPRMGTDEDRSNPENE